MNLLTKGNTKVSALLFDLPTEVCPVQCKSCYAKKAEVRFPNTLAKRRRNYLAAQQEDFTDSIITEIRKSRINIVRPHSSGDFFSQVYVNKWQTIAATLYDTNFYAYTKRKQDFDFTHIDELPNFNLINSLTEDGGYNYGTKEYCDTLVQQGYYLCPCIKGHNDTADCMVSCQQCLTEPKVCFEIH